MQYTHYKCKEIINVKHILSQIHGHYNENENLEPPLRSFEIRPRKHRQNHIILKTHEIV